MKLRQRELIIALPHQALTLFGLLASVAVHQFLLELGLEGGVWAVTLLQRLQDPRFVRRGKRLREGQEVKLVKQFVGY